MELLVTIQIEGEDVLAGKLYQNVRNGRETATFSYAQDYLRNPAAIALAPDMPLVESSFHSEGLLNFRALEDCMPDRWGRNLLAREEKINSFEEHRTARTLFESDLLVGVNDKTRQGAIRIWNVDGEPLSLSNRSVPREVDLASLLRVADEIDEAPSEDIKDLISAGSSLGGARPKACVQGEQGQLWIAKFPKKDESLAEDICAWEKVAIDLMEDFGINVPQSKLLRIKGRAVLLLKRFDRDGEKRIPYISGISAVQGFDGERYSYLELVEFLEREGAQPAQDIKELWKRALFSAAIGNTDNHMRNYGFLREKNGWVLSPAFDVNPTEGDNVNT